MLRFAADENLNNNIVRGLLRRIPTLDLVRIQDTEIYGADDPTVLAWTAREQRILLTHDINTITRYAYDRIRAGQPMPGVFEVNRQSAAGKVIEDLLLLAETSLDNEWEGQILFLPFE
jgi:predicted nuclease of predicted toxin-antitoxin system